MPAFTSFLLAANTAYQVSEDQKMRSDAKTEQAKQEQQLAEQKKTEDNRKRANIRSLARNTSTYQTNYSSGSGSSMTGMGSQTLGG